MTTLKREDEKAVMRGEMRLFGPLSLDFKVKKMEKLQLQIHL